MSKGWIILYLILFVATYSTGQWSGYLAATSNIEKQAVAYHCATYTTEGEFEWLGKE